jgi:hypothetical protein
MPAAGENYLVGFDYLNYEVVGAIGADGLEAGTAVPRKPFPGPIYLLSFAPASNGNAPATPVSAPAPTLLCAGRTLYQLKRDGSLMSLLQTDRPIELLTQTQRVVDPVDKSPEVMHPMLLTEDEALILSPFTKDRQPQVIVRHRQPALRNYMVQAGIVPSTGEFLLRLFSRSTGKLGLAVYYGADGTFEREVRLPEIVNPQPNRHATEEAIISVVMPPALMALLVPTSSPNVAAGITALPITLCGTMAILTTALTFLLLRHRAVQTRAVWLWTVLALLLGPLGLLVMLNLRGLPVATRCRSCRRPMRVDQNACAACHTPVPPPEPNGTEVLPST